MKEHEQRDELIARYQEASAQDTRRPADRVREAVLAHARTQIAANLHDAALAVPSAPAANQARWKISMLASVVLAALTGLLVLQFDRGTPQEKELALGLPPPGTAANPPVAAALPAPRAAPDPAPGAGESAAALQSRAAAAVSPAPPAAPSGRATRKESDMQAGAPPRAARQSEVAAETKAEATPAAAAAAGLPFPASVPAPAPAAKPAAAAAAAPMAAAGKLADTAAQEKSNSAPAPAARLQAQGRIAQEPASALHEAARAGRVAELDQLLARGAALNAPDPEGRTPLMLAVINGHAEMVQRLLAAGANPALQDRAGLTALQHARRLGLERIAALIEAGS